VTVDGRVGRLGSEIHHYTYRDLSHQLLTIDRYTTLAVKQMVSEHRRATVFDLIVQGPIAFGRNYVLKMGIRDGAPGLIVSVMNAYYVWLKFAKLWAHQRADGRRTRDDGPPHE
jgi:hypothetical protein